MAKEDRAMPRDGFERFYLEKVALGEGCGCAEHVTRIREIEAMREARSFRLPRRERPGRLLSWLRRALALKKHV